MSHRTAMRGLTQRPWMVVGGAVLAAACGENLLAPGAGTCPDYCPPEKVATIDSVLADNIVRDSAYVGYVLPSEAGGLQVLSDSSAPYLTASRAVIRFIAFPDSIALGGSDTTKAPVLQVDSFKIQLPILDRSAGQTNLELVLYRLPAAVDTNASFSDLDPYFADSAQIAVVPIPDSVVSGKDTLRLDPAAFPTFDADGRRAAIGVALRAPAGGYVILGTVNGGSPAVLERYARVDSAGTPTARADGKLPDFDTFVAPPMPAPDPSWLRVGGAPSARALLRVNLPPLIADSSEVVRATLLLIPAAPVIGAPGDTLRIVALGVGTDVGAKSPALSESSDAILARLVALGSGATDTVRLDVTSLVAGWTKDSTRPRTFMLRAIPEANGFAELWFGSSGSGALRPRLQVTFVPPLSLGGR